MKSGSAIGPTMTFPRNIIDFTQPHEPAAIKGRPADVEREYAIGCENLRKAKRAGVLMLTGTDSGFAVTPYGEWHATEPEIFVRDLGFSPAEALICATAVTSRFIANGSRFGVLEQGRFADFIAVDGSPLDDITLLQASGASAMCISQGSGCTSRHEATTHARSPTEASATGPTSTRRSVSGRSDRAGSVSPRGRIANRSARRSQRYDCVDASDPAQLIPSLALVRHRQSHHGRSAASPRSPTSPDVARGARR